MDDAQIGQIDLILTDLIDRATAKVTEELERIFADHAAKGALRSGATIKRSARELEGIATGLVEEAASKVKQVSMSAESFGMMADDVATFLASLAPHIERVIIPKNQADIEKAMAEWIEGRGYSAATSTIRGRARRIWDRLAAPDDA